MASKVDSKSSDSQDKKSSKIKPSFDEKLNRKLPEASTPPDSPSKITHSECISKTEQVISSLPSVKSPSKLDRRESVASSIEEHSRKSSIDEESTVVIKSNLEIKALPSVQVESDWSSGEDFKSSSITLSEPTKQVFDKTDEDSTTMAVMSEKEEFLHESATENDQSAGNSRVKQTRHLPRTYQVDNEGTVRKGVYRSHGSHSSKRYISGPNSPSPPPSYGSYRKRPRYSSQEHHERSRHRRSRPYSPVSRSHYKHSRSPQRFHSPGFKGKSPSPR